MLVVGFGVVVAMMADVAAAAGGVGGSGAGGERNRFVVVGNGRGAGRKQPRKYIDQACNTSGTVTTVHIRCGVRPTLFGENNHLVSLRSRVQPQRSQCKHRVLCQLGSKPKNTTYVLAPGVNAERTEEHTL